MPLVMYHYSNVDSLKQILPFFRGGSQESAQSPKFFPFGIESAAGGMSDIPYSNCN